LLHSLRPPEGKRMLVERTAGHGASSIVDVLDRVLDKGLSIAGDIRIAVAEVELLTIRIRLIICSIDKAREIGLDWWKDDRHFSPRSRNDVPDELQKQIKDLARKIALLSAVPTARRQARKSA